MGRTCTVGIMTVAIAAASAARAGDELPRYRLEPGMELSYKGSSTFRHQNGMHIDDQESTAWIVRRNGDGSVRVVLRQGSRFTATSVVETLKSLFKKQAKPPMDYNFGYFDLVVQDAAAYQRLRQLAEDARVLGGSARASRT